MFYFADATYVLTGDSQVPWSDGVRLVELRAESDTRAVGVLVAADGRRAEFNVGLPRRFGESALGEFPAVDGELVPDSTHREAVDEAVRAFQVAAGVHLEGGLTVSRPAALAR